MNPRTTTSGRAARSRLRPPTPVRRPGVYLGVAAAGAVLVNVLIGVEPSAQAEAEADAGTSVSVARELGLSAQSEPIDVAEDLQPLEELTVSRNARQAAETQAQEAQAAADQAELDRRKAEEEAEARAAAEAAAAAAAAAEAARAAAASAADSAAATPRGQAAGGAAAAAASTTVSVVAKITNSAGPISPRVQAAANAVVSNVPGAGSITLGGTRPSAADPAGHPSGNALDYMVMSDKALGDAIVEYHRAHWAELGVDYLIWQQRYLASPDGAWRTMENRGSATANHMDHPHVNYK